MQKVLITGGSGFIGSNLAARLLADGAAVTIYDNLSRAGVERNLAWLRDFGDKLQFVRGDVRDAAKLAEVVAVSDYDTIFHLAAQVAVTTSVADPRTDFEVNAGGTLNLLEAVRCAPRRDDAPPPAIFFTSTNKVYGNLAHLGVTRQGDRYAYRDISGVDESCPLDLHSPYGCSKGAADQYVRDYARIYGIPTVVFRMSCIYGPRQFGNEDQGWLAHFLISALLNRPITIYGDGRQVRDVLFVDDLVRAFYLARDHISVTAGQVYNIGGGVNNTIAIWRELAPLIEQLHGSLPPVSYGDWRPGDQPIFVCNTDKAARDFGWQPQIGVREGVARLYAWTKGNSDKRLKIKDKTPLTMA